MLLSAEQKETLIQLADVLLRMKSGTEMGNILCAKMDASWNGYRPYLITWKEFDKDEDFILVSDTYKPVTYLLDSEPEENIITGSIDPKSGRRRRVIDVEALRCPVKANPIPDQVDWDKVPAFKLPELDSVPGWSKAKDIEVNEKLISESLMKPETSPVAPKIDFNKIFFHPNEKIIPLGITEALAKRLHEQYPETDFDKYFQKKISWQDVFSKLTPTPAINEVMRTSPENLKISVLRTLVDTGHFDSMPFKMRVTGLLLSRGYSQADEAAEAFLSQAVGLRGLSDEDFERFRWVYQKKDFYTFQSVISSLLERLDENQAQEKSLGISFESLGGRIPVNKLWTRFEEAWASLTVKQKKAVSTRYMGEERSTLEETALKLGISVASLRDRVMGAAKKLRDAFPEFAELSPARTHTAIAKRPLIYDGLYRRASAEQVRPLIRVKKVGALELREMLPVSADKKIEKRPVDPVIARWLEEYRLKAEFVEKLDEPKDLVFKTETDLTEYEDHEPGQPRTRRLYEVFK